MGYSLGSAFSRKELLRIIVLVNLAGAFYGFAFFYSIPLAETPIYLWPFVPDCPLYALWMAIVFASVAFGVKNDLFNFVGVAGALKYGFWTVFVLLFYAKDYLPADGAFTYYLLLFGHVGLFFETFLLIGRIGVKKYYAAIAFLWLFANELSDYVFFDTHPPIPAGSEAFMLPFSVATTIIFAAVAFYAFTKWKKPIFALF